MAYELREKQGTLSPNKWKEKDSQPDLKGTVLIDGVLRYLSAWHKKGENAKGPWELYSVSIGDPVPDKDEGGAPKYAPVSDEEANPIIEDKPF